MASGISERELQSLFLYKIGQLICVVYGHGYDPVLNKYRWELTLGEGFRSDRRGHMAGSLHYEKLAQDLNLFVNDVYQGKDCPEWQWIGAKWKTFHPLARWGGDFKSVDLNHFSFAWEGKS